MRGLWIAVILTGCKASAEDIAAARCNPAWESQQCDDTGTRRMTCNPANGQWTPLELCVAPQVCQLLAADADGVVATACALPGSDADAWSQDGVAHDATGQDAAGQDAAGTDAAGKDAGVQDTVPTDAAQPDAQKADGNGQELPDVHADASPGVLANASCFQKHCPQQTAACLQASTCIAAINTGFACVQACGGGQGCITQCQGSWTGNTQAFALVGCGMLICAGGCGDGLCSINETATTCPGDCKPPTTGSCVGHCGGKSTDCFCDGVCVGQGDCCSDYAAVCGG